MSPLPCLVCGNTIEPVFAEADEHQPLGALTFRGCGQYGSEFDLCGQLEVVVCDGCLRACAGRVASVKSEMTTVETRTPWTPDAAGGP